MQNLNVPYYIVEEIVEYIEQKATGKNRSMKWENIKALLRLAVANERLTEEQAKFLEKQFCREDAQK